MSNTPHELAEEFPGRHDAIAALKAKDAHFARLVDEYHQVNRAVHRAETQIEPTDSAHEQELRRKRLHLKDSIAQALAGVRA